MTQHQKPPNTHCWVYSKWGRKKARVLLEFLGTGYEDHDQIFVSVVLQDQKLTINEKNITVKKEDIEYIED